MTKRIRCQHWPKPEEDDITYMFRLMVWKRVPLKGCHFGQSYWWANLHTESGRRVELVRCRIQNVLAPPALLVAPTCPLMEMPKIATTGCQTAVRPGSTAMWSGIHLLSESFAGARWPWAAHPQLSFLCRLFILYVHAAVNLKVHWSHISPHCDIFFQSSQLTLSCGPRAWGVWCCTALPFESVARPVIGRFYWLLSQSLWLWFSSWSALWECRFSLRVGFKRE